MGYTLPVRRLLNGLANVHRPLENGGPTINGRPKLDGWLRADPWRVIHFNFGLHDLRIMETGQHQVELPAYEDNLRAMVGRLKQTGAKLIWATTTPVPVGKVSPARNAADVIEYNLAARRIMLENGIEIDDLFTLVLPRLSTLQLPVNVHYKPEGYEVMAAQVARSIRAALAG